MNHSTLALLSYLNEKQSNHLEFFPFSPGFADFRLLGIRITDYQASIALLEQKGLVVRKTEDVSLIKVETQHPEFSQLFA